jgi:putative peptidoglycan lipid II flippase
VIGFAIFLSRIAGLVRERVFAHYFGATASADAFKAALRIPNLLQNLFGEGVLSASFIPVYSRLRAEGRHEEAVRVASAVASLLALLMSVLVAAGVATTPWLIDLVAPGFEGERRIATIALVRILFPGTGLLVLSAWSLGVLNSHRRFFLPYVAPVLWNVTQIAVTVTVGMKRSGYDLALWVAAGAVLGSLLQFSIQLPSALRLVRGLRPTVNLGNGAVKEVFSNLGPVLVGRGIVQLSAYVDSMLASWLPMGAVAALAYAQILYTLPISLFGMAVSAAELPEMSSELGEASLVDQRLRARIDVASSRILFFIVPTSVGFLALGDVISGLLFQTGRFSAQDTRYVWWILGGSTVGLGAATLGRLYSSTFYALRDTRTPLRFAVIRLLLTALLGWLGALVLPRWFGIPARFGAVGLTLSAGLAGWVEFFFLRYALQHRIGKNPIAVGPQLVLWGAALTAGLLVSLVRLTPVATTVVGPVVLGLGTLPLYGATYLALTWRMGNPIAQSFVAAFARRFTIR